MSSSQTMVRLGAGKRRHRVALQKAVITVDALGGRKATSWTEFGKWWAALEEAPSFNNEADAALTHRVTGLYRSDVVENHAAKIDMRVVGADVTLKVVLVQDPKQRHKDLVLHCVDAT